ncbi:hypothetical protein HY745_00755, partial [Candidatus Desantisbacteria bacterium]|nr:hypothetical protein [Candidatus Desantisbacteria bacterium]
GKIASEALYISTSRIQAIVNKPRLFYVPDMDVMSIGLPAFSLEKGKIVGIVVLRMKVLSSSMNRSPSIMHGGRDTPILPIILPASQIIEVASQVPMYDSTK